MADRAPPDGAHAERWEAGMAPSKKKPDQHTTIGKDLIRNGSGVITAADVDAAIAADQDTAKPTPRKTPAKKTPAKKAAPKKRATRKKATIPEPIEPWDQRPDETSPAFLAFCVYRELGLTRSLSKVRSQWGQTGGELGANPAKPPSATSIDTWSSKYSWVLRAAAYDKHLDREWVLEQKERRRKAARRNADMAAQAMELVQKRIAQMAKQMTAELEAEDYDKEHPPPLDVLDLRRLVESLGKLERLSLGESTENVQVTGKDGKDLVPDLTALSAEDLVERMKQIRESIDKRLGEVGEAGAA